MNENIVKIDYLDKEIYLVKTAHVSKDSINDVRSCIEEVNPDSICIELDQDRYNSLTKKDKWRDTDISEIIKNKQVGFLLVNCILASFQRRMAKKMDSNTGGEMLEAISISKERNINLVLADRSIKKTFSRIWYKLDTKEKAKLITSIIMSIFDDEEISEEEISSLKEADALEAALNEVGKEFPIVKEVLVDERDKYLSQKIKNAKGNKIVAVIGAAHSLGIKKYIDQDIDIEEFDNIPKNNKKSYLKWILPLLIIGLFIFTILNNKDLGLSQLKSWVLWHGTLSAIGALIALAHPLSILTAFLLSPLTSLNPLVASGWFAGLVEAKMRKPKVKDFEDIALDTDSLKGFWKNRVTRILLVVVFTNLFSSLATMISGIDVVKKFIESL